MMTGLQQRDAYVQACECELNAFKPGNVSIYSEGHGMTVDDFRLSAEASASPLTDPDLSLGKKIYYALDATVSAVGCNTNLGIVLLCAPLIEAVQSVSGGNLRYRLRRVLAMTTRDDAEWVYRGIRLAKPAGLGISSDHDVSKAPGVTLTEAMRIAGSRDRVAYQYISAYSDVFEFAKKRYHTSIAKWGEENWATVSVFVGLLKRIPDSHIQRKYGNRFTGMVATRMARLDEVLSNSSSPEQAICRLKEVDGEFKAAGINPGTTADLTVATLLAVRLEMLLSEHEEDH